MNQYEAMFLFDPTFGASFENCEKEIRRLMDRAEAELLFCRRWDERRLAYRVEGRKRGVYALTYFKAPPSKIAPLERDVQLSENILRVLVLRADDMTPEMMELSLAHHESSEDDGRPSRERGGGRERAHAGRGGDRAEAESPERSGKREQAASPDRAGRPEEEREEPVEAPRGAGAAVGDVDEGEGDSERET